MAKKKIVIVGAGMAGLVCAIECANQGFKVQILERNDKVGKKLLVTGNGRCNISNKHMTKLRFHSESLNLFDSIVGQCHVEPTTAFFSSIGIDFVELEEGKLYPMSLQATSVIKALLLECERLGVDIIYESRVTQVEYDNKYKIYSEKKVYYSDVLIIATGGKSYTVSGSTGDGYTFAQAFGHQIIEPMPSIVQIETNGKYNKSLKGFRCDAMGRLIREGDRQELQHEELQHEELLREEFGEILFTEYGLSGPVILQLSTLVAPELKKGSSLKIEIDFLPNMKEDALDKYLLERLHRLSYRSVEEAFIGFLNHRLVIPLLKEAGIELIKKAGDVTKKERQQLVYILKHYQEKVTAPHIWSQAQVTKGGVDCREVNSDTLESKLQENLFFIGEVLDMDGDCGGFNLQWAISSAIVVADNLIKNRLDKV